jgi:hypothetical protein
MKHLMLAVLVGLLATGAAAAHEGAKPKRVPLPAMTIEQGEKCVEPTDVMRREHMQFILHQRDETMHRGIRTSKHSFKNCVNCHAAKTGSVLGKDGFCASCHSYAAVSVDCFSCHTDKPEPVAAKPEAVPTAVAKPVKPAAKGTKR